MPELLRLSVLLLLIFQDVCSANTRNDGNDIRASTTSLPTGSQGSTLSGAGWSSSQNATCPSRTANYITHTLPQQCLRTDRASINAANLSETTSEVQAANPTPSVVASSDGSAVDDHARAATQNATTGNSSSSTEAKPDTASAKPPPTTAASSVETPTAVVQETETETDSPLDNANFLSFEDWKRQNLVKAGQSPDNIGVRSQPLDGERKRPGINNALDTLGEESEIELDFSGFGTSHDNDNRERSSNSDTPDPQSSLSPPTARSKDAGKTCKERTNYASFDCAATILKNNPESKSGSSVLVENKDSYMLNKCSAANKFLIVELCNDILVDTIVLANYEFFSSIFRHFRISVSDRYPVKAEKWKDLGTFEARNTREVQAFLIENPLIWARYLRIEFLTHYGKEYYCPVSLLRVHGTTMMDEFRHQEEIARGESQDDEIVAEPDVPVHTAIPQEALTVSPEAEQSTVQAIFDANESPSTTVPEPKASTVSEDRPAFSEGVEESMSRSPVHSDLPQLPDAPKNGYFTCRVDEGPLALNTTMPSPAMADDSISSKESSTSTSQLPSATPKSGSSETTSTSSEHLRRESHQSDISKNASSMTTDSSSKVDIVNTSTIAHRSNSSSTSSAIVAPPVSRPREEAAHTSLPKSSTPTSNSTRAAPSGTTAHPAQPSTQESFFKSVHKRLQQLESNSTLSLQYIEEQSRILRDAFSKVEKRQLTSTTNFLAHLNSTVMGELQGFRKAYDQLWQSTVIELEGQREQYQREMLALSTRLTLVADELVWQKRMGIVQSTLLLLCLALVLFNRTGNSALVEMPLLQQMMNKSQAALRAGWESPTGSRSPEDRSPENRSPVSLFRKKLWRHSTEPGSGHATDATDNDSRPQSRDATHAGLDVTLRAPTPDLLPSDSEEEGEWKEVPEVQSGPATPRGTREALGSPTWIEDDVRPSSSLG